MCGRGRGGRLCHNRTHSKYVPHVSYYANVPNMYTQKQTHTHTDSKHKHRDCEPLRRTLTASRKSRFYVPARREKHSATIARRTFVGHISSTCARARVVIIDFVQVCARLRLLCKYLLVRRLLAVGGVEGGRLHSAAN